MCYKQTEKENHRKMPVDTIREREACKAEESDCLTSLLLSDGTAISPLHRLKGMGKKLGKKKKKILIN